MPPTSKQSLLKDAFAELRKLIKISNHPPDRTLTDDKSNTRHNNSYWKNYFRRACTDPHKCVNPFKAKENHNAHFTKDWEMLFRTHKPKKHKYWLRYFSGIKHVPKPEDKVATIVKRVPIFKPNKGRQYYKKLSKHSYDGPLGEYRKKRVGAAGGEAGGEEGGSMGTIDYKSMAYKPQFMSMNEQFKEDQKKQTLKTASIGHPIVLPQVVAPEAPTIEEPEVTEPLDGQKEEPVEDPEAGNSPEEEPVDEEPVVEETPPEEEPAEEVEPVPAEVPEEEPAEEEPEEPEETEVEEAAAAGGAAEAVEETEAGEAMATPEGMMEEMGLSTETMAMMGAGALGVAALAGLGMLAAGALAGMGSANDLLKKKIEMLENELAIEEIAISEFQKSNTGTKEVRTEIEMLKSNIEVQTDELRKNMDFTVDRIGDVLRDKQLDEEDMGFG